MESALIWDSLLISLSISVPRESGPAVAAPHGAVVSLFPLCSHKSRRSLLMESEGETLHSAAVLSDSPAKPLMSVLLVTA